MRSLCYFHHVLSKKSWFIWSVKVTKPDPKVAAIRSSFSLLYCCLLLEWLDSPISVWVHFFHHSKFKNFWIMKCCGQFWQHFYKELERTNVLCITAVGLWKIRLVSFILHSVCIGEEGGKRRESTYFFRLFPLGIW